MIPRLEYGGRNKIREIGTKKYFIIARIKRTRKGGCRKIVIFPLAYERKILAL